MDVGAPSNFVRILEIFDNKFVDLKNKVNAVSVSDSATAATMLKVHADHGYTLDPHGAVGFWALSEYLETHPGQEGIVMETAHPVKFDSVNEILKTEIPIPAAVGELVSKQEFSIEMANDYNVLRDVLISKI
ncbi:MAG: hypothetical protein ABIV48_08740 [Pyrinomonadaceae bacterium]